MLTSDYHTADAVVRSSKTFGLLFFQVVVDCFLPVRSVVTVARIELLDMVVCFWIQCRSLIHDVDLCVLRESKTENLRSMTVTIKSLLKRVTSSTFILSSNRVFTHTD